jgi:hypothetical protein
MRAPVLAALLLFVLPLPAKAQDAGGWRLGAGAGLGLVLSGHDMQDPGDPGLALRLSALKGDAGKAWGFEWIGTWLEGAPGGDHRHHLGVTMARAPGGGALWLRGGIGLAWVTVAEVDAPPADGPPGDAVVGIGDYGTIGVSGGVEARWTPMGRVELVPAADVLLQRAGGRTLTLAALTLRLQMGGR